MGIPAEDPEAVSIEYLLKLNINNITELDIENILNDNMDSENVYDNFGNQYTIKCYERGE